MGECRSKNANPKTQTKNCQSRHADQKCKVTIITLSGRCGHRFILTVLVVAAHQRSSTLSCPLTTDLWTAQHHSLSKGGWPANETINSTSAGRERH